ncbi:MAG: hypothetical protein [Arizlama microvirus]|nr:MAG: hypothetical protein [Arizlama microvirus]
MYRSKIRNRGRDRKVFSKTASGVHIKNLQSGPMRGGIKL